MSNTQHPTPTSQTDLSVWLEYLANLHVSAIDMGLSRVMPVAEYLGITKPDAQVITVAGTNGKGSTTATISHICEKAGYKTALYQSPHVLAFNERVQINNQQVSDQQLVDAFVEVDNARIVLNQSLSFFETTTLAAMLIFKQQACDVWVLEIGLGGRLDVVNIIDPDVAVITNIGVDHVDWLGDDIEKIGYEKAGILRKNIPCVLASSNMPASVWSKIHEGNNPVHCVTQQYDYALSDSCANQALGVGQPSGNTWTYSNAAVTMVLPVPSIALENAAAGITAVLASSLHIQQQQIAQALTEINLLGRFYKTRLVTPTAAVPMIMDVAHNDDGVKFFLQNFLPVWQQHKDKYKNAQLRIIFSMLADKDMTSVLKQMNNTFDLCATTHWYTAELDNPRAKCKDDLLQAFINEQMSVHANSSIQDTLIQVEQDCHVDDMVLVLGSFHTVAEVLENQKKQ